MSSTPKFRSCCCCWSATAPARRDTYFADKDRREAIKGCPFCAIAQGAEQHRVVFQTDRLVVFSSLRPQSRPHLLVIPRSHVANTDVLEGPEDLHLAEEMERVGREVLLQRAPPGSRIKLGYHVPPWRSVDHLHLHCMALPHVPAWAALKYCLPGVWLSSDALVARLRRGSRSPQRSAGRGDEDVAGVGVV